MSLEHSPARTILRGKQVEKKIGKSRTQIWRDIRAGTFPAPVELGPNSVGWFEDEISEWLNNRPRVNYASVPDDGDFAALRKMRNEADVAEAEARR